MRTSLPEEETISTFKSLPPPLPSINASRPRRHTINRPDSALWLLSDLSADEGEEDEMLDRMSDILSSLIQEANNAVNGVDKEDEEDEENDQFKSVLKIAPKAQPPPSRLPRLRKTRASHTPGIVHVRDSSASSVSSLFSTTSSGTAASSRPSSPAFKKPLTFSRRRSSGTTVSRPVSCPTLPRSNHVKRHSAQPVLQQPLVDSFKRLDSSMALVDSLSRDLASAEENEKKRSFDSRFSTIFLLLPLLHIPHALMTMILDPPRHPSSSPMVSTTSPLTSVFTWAFLFVLANLVVDHVVISSNPIRWLTSKASRLSIPGTYKGEDALQQRKRRLKNEPLDVPAIKRTRAFVFEQQNLDKRPRLTRRNSF
ncbi:hypothetical protein DFQ30_000488 [Apophysomyces sp. BC1015]|nr:hypothetical protein DFQ30_000488 [Apophysomyces sp. BC1015]KAG0176542.1 hypothetical protein DFQ29_005993 [Apophysomyces sp. BC1021]